MSDPLKQFFKAVHENDVDDILLKSSFVKSAFHSIEDITIFDKKPPIKPTNPVPTYEESAFLEPKNVGTLFDVTKKDIPETVKPSNKLSDVSYRIKGFTASADYKKDDKVISAYAGENLGVGFKQIDGLKKTEVNLKHNVENGKTSLNYTVDSPAHTYGVSLFNRNGGCGVQTNYKTMNGFNSAFALDKDGASIKVGCKNDYNNCHLELDMYATVEKKHPYVGVGGRISF